MSHPYRHQPRRAFWKGAVAEVHLADMADLWDPIVLRRSDRVATAGSCFAQHIGRNLALRGANYMDLEPAPPVFDDTEQARRFGYGVFSCRYGNIYTSRQLLQLVGEALEMRAPSTLVWERNGRYFDALRPGIDPVGLESPEAVIAARKAHLAAVREMLTTLDLLVFTLGLTETWVTADGTFLPSAPGAIAGTYDPDAVWFHNLSYREVRSDIEAAFKQIKALNPGARMLLTVSPVPLVATATGQHVLPATTYSKSVLRAVAGDLAAQHDDIGYFPSYEIIIGHPSRGMFFNPDLRTVNGFGVDLVMKHFFSGPLAAEFSGGDASDEEEGFELICDEEANESA
ncbi:GSCFA domain-containing protein [Novosphingobium huizhouense]|uniref:GSCFA domain-containing protein n=1 Tax=Novosphingobium huizhouense TaxID=2866625 RepID=UPI001CD81DCF|nr:GSCFA domain-containing protein [Novosphingobium huizhouense]